MSWKEVVPGRFERPFDAIEKFYFLISSGAAALSREVWTVNIAAKLELDSSLGDAESALRSAWKATRFKLPQIGAFATVGETYVYESPNDVALKTWLDETFIVESMGTTTAELYAHAKPSSLAKIHYLPYTSEILIRSSHYRVDGIGALHLLDTFLKALSDPHNQEVEFGTEAVRLSPGLLNLPTTVSAEMEAAVNEELKIFVQNLPSIGLKPDIQGSVPGASRRCEIELSSHLTSTIVSCCKAQRFSVTSAVHAACIRATQSLLDPTSSDSAAKWTTWISFDFRKYCPPPYNGPDHGVSVYHTGLPATLVPKNFSADALEIQKFNSRDLRTLDGNLFKYLECFVDKVRTLFTTAVPEGISPPAEPLLGSLGVVDKYFTSKYDGKVEVLDFWLGVEQLSPQLQVYVWTRMGRMKLSICYNENFYSAKFVERFLESMRAELLLGLKIDEKSQE